MSEVNKDLLLMMEDTVVARINVDTGLFDVMNEPLLPWTMKDRIRKTTLQEKEYSKYDMTQIIIASRKNTELLTSWLSSRVLPLSRKNAKWIYNTLKLEQRQDEVYKAKIALFCRAVSLQDNYWVKLHGDTRKWKDVNIRTNHLNEILAQIALHGSSLTLQGEITTPELTTHGAYAKCWKREDGDLWLYKMGADGNTESRIEVMVSKLLSKLPVNRLEYLDGESLGVYCCKCKCMTTEDISILSGMDFITYCNVHNINPDKEMLRLDADSIYKMWIVDYLISNRDRHGQNWGWFYNNKTMEILGCHPLFDHNNAFDTEWMKDDNASYQFGNMTIKQAAMEAMKHVDFYFKEPIKRDDFITQRQYDSFVRRAEQLGIKVKHNLDSALSNLGAL